VKQQTRSRIADGLDRARLLRPAERVRERWLAMRAEDGPAVAIDGLALPPSRLRLLVDGRSGDAERFLRMGELMAGSIRQAVADSGSEMTEMAAILDFGCGCGRVARNWADLGGPEVHGSDYNEELTSWCEHNLPFLQVGRNELEPPTRHEPESFDLIYALSVLSHLSEPLQDAWVAEFRRLLRPGGLLIVSVLGESLRDRLSGERRERFDRGELVVERPRMAGSNVCSAYHPRAYVTAHLLAGFADVRPFEFGPPELPLMQDAYIARRAPGPA
jgi:2-polyprenyl-3-methyl-5-hydroxy-6-metoxy-1,4-benzoquinol methylase